MKEQKGHQAALGLLYAAMFGLLLVVAYTGNLPPQLAMIPNYDKPGHLILYGFATYLGHRVLRWRRIGRFYLPVWVVAFGSFTLIEEGLQAFSPHRSLDGLDLVMSFLGIGLGYWLAERELARHQMAPERKLKR
jgi:polysaccharide biosynthesis protein VpsQ